MGYATILTLLSAEQGGERALGAALILGEACKARVDVLQVAVDPERSVPLLGDGMTGPMVADLTASLAEEAARSRAAAERLFARLVKEPGLPQVAADAPPEPGRFAVSFETLPGDEAAVAAERARLHDLTVVARGPLEEGASGPTLEAVLFDSGRPVLVAPQEGLARLPLRVAVAWNGSREAARAVSAALPLLRLARTVTVLSGRGHDDPPVALPSALARYLQGHGVTAATWAFEPDDRPVAQSLVNEAKKSGAELLVMGAYGHSRLRELVLGGATRAALRAGELALLMTH